MNTIRDIIRTKGSEIWSISPDETVYNALQMMADKNSGALLVKTEDHVEGILTERDCVRKIDLMGKASRETKVSQIMTSEVVSIQGSENLEECMTLMIDKNIRHLPIYEGDDLLGLISIRDVMREMVGLQKELITQLERFITGGGR